MSASISHRPLFSCLVLLDLNGTLVYRTLQPVPDARCAFKGRNGKFVYPRHGANELVEGLSARGYTVCVLSSMAERNVNEAIDRTMSASARAALTARLCGSVYNRADPHGVAEYDTIRNMDAVWARFPAFSARNTVLVDNEARKFEAAPRCGIVIPEMGPSDFKAELLLCRPPLAVNGGVSAMAAAAGAGSGGALSDLLTYLSIMAEEAPSDVQDWMETQPFELLPTQNNNNNNNTNNIFIPSSPTMVAAAATTAAAAADAAALSPDSSGGALIASINRLSLHDDTPAPTSPIAKTVSNNNTTHSSGGGGGGARSPPPNVNSPARGLSLQFICIEDGRFTFFGDRGNIFVRGPVTVPFRLDARMDYQRLLDAAKEAGVELDISVGSGGGGGGGGKGASRSPRVTPSK
jgi:hypothetical protein